MMILVILLFAMFGGVCSVAKLSLSYASPLFFIGARMALAGVILLIYHRIRYGKEYKFQPKQLILLFLLGVFNIYFTNLFAYFSLEELDSFKTCFIYNLSPFISALFSYFVFSETLSNNQWLGLTIGFLGFTFLVVDDFILEDLSSFSFGHFIMLLSVFSSVYGWVLMRQLVFDNNCSPALANGGSMFVGGSSALIHSYFTENWDPVPVSDYAGYFQCSILLIVFSNLICYNLYGYLLKTYTATFMSFAGFLTPLFTALFGWMFLEEIVTWNFFLAFSIVLVGLLIFSKNELSYKVSPATS